MAERIGLPFVTGKIEGFRLFFFPITKMAGSLGSENDKPLILRTNNQGFEWKDWQKVNLDEKSSVEINRNFSGFNDICFDPSGKVWIVGDGGIVEAVADERNLRVISIFKTRETLYRASCNASGEVWAVGEHSAAYHFQMVG